MADDRMRLAQALMEPQPTPEQIAEFQRLQDEGSGQAVETVSPFDFVVPPGLGTALGAGLGTGIGAWHFLKGATRTMPPAAYRSFVRDWLPRLSDVGKVGIGGAAAGYIQDLQGRYDQPDAMKGQMPPVPSYPPKGPF